MNRDAKFGPQPFKVLVHGARFPARVSENCSVGVRPEFSPVEHQQHHGTLNSGAETHHCQVSASSSPLKQKWAVAIYIHRGHPNRSPLPKLRRPAFSVLSRPSLCPRTTLCWRS